MYLSVVIPIHNEEEILEPEVCKLISAFDTVTAGRDYEILLVENGSTDETLSIAKNLSDNLQKIRVISLKNPDYGGAMKEGILQSQGQCIAIFNIDFWDAEALKKALTLFEKEGVDMVVCSKTMKGSKDLRPLKRRLITRGFNLVLRTFFGYRGTDTHGIKFFRAEKIVPIAQKCWTGGGMMDTELLLRAQNAGLKTVEIPVICVEKEKRKSFFGIMKHGPGVLRDLAALFRELRLGK